MMLRGLLRTDARDRWRLRSIRPCQYPFPTDGPVGIMRRPKSALADSSGGASRGFKPGAVGRPAQAEPPESDGPDTVPSAVTSRKMPLA